MCSLRTDWSNFERSIDGNPFFVTTIINNVTSASTLIDTGCLSNGHCDSLFTQKHNRARLPIKPREVIDFDSKVSSIVNEDVTVDIDLDGHRQSKTFLYVVPIGYYDMILGMPWIVSQDARINGLRSEMIVRSTETKVRSKDSFLSTQNKNEKALQISAVAFNQLLKNH